MQLGMRSFPTPEEEAGYGQLSLRGISFNGYSTADSLNGSDVTLHLPFGILKDDVVYVFYGLSSQFGGGTSSSGWTQVGSTTNNGVRSQVFRKAMGDDPDGKIILTGASSGGRASVALAVALRGVNTTTPEDATPTTATGTSAAPNSPSITPVTNNAMVFSVAFSQEMDIEPDILPTEPTGYSSRALASSVNVGNEEVGIGLAAREVIVPAAEDPGAWAWSGSDDWVAWSIAVRPR